MKKTVIIFALMAFVGIANGQTIRKVGGGVNFTSITGTGDDVSGNLGWQAGGSVQFGEKFYLEPGVFYMVENAEATVINNGVSTFSDSQFKGFRVPVAVGLNVLGNTESSLGLRVFGGGSAFFLTGVSDNLNKSDFNSTNWGVFAGVGADISIIFIDLTYEWSVTNLQKNITDIDFGKTNGVFLTVGIRFQRGLIF